MIPPHKPLASIMAMGAGLVPAAVAATIFSGMQPLLIQAPDETCGYIEGEEDHPFQCQTSELCALYFPTSFYAANPAWGSTTTGTGSDAPTRRRALSVGAAPTSSTTTLAPVTTPAPVITQARGFASPTFGAIACCNPAQEQCTVQPTTCVDNGLHPASILCKGNCPDDDMTLKCTASQGRHCRQFHMATPIPYIPNRENVNRRHAKQQVATLNTIISGWFCGLDEIHKTAMSASQETFTYGGSSTTTESPTAESPTATETPALTAETHTEEKKPVRVPQPGQISQPDQATQLDQTQTSESGPVPQPDQAPQPDPQPAANSVPTSLEQGQPEQGQPEQGQLVPANNAECEWVDDFGHCCEPPPVPAYVYTVECEWINGVGDCCDESEAVYYNPRRLRRVRRSEVTDRDEKEATSASVSTQPLPITTEPLTVTSSHFATNTLPLVTSIPTGAPNTTIVEAIYILEYMYQSQTGRSLMSEVAASYQLVPYTDTDRNKTSRAPRQTGNPRQSRPSAEANKGDSQAGMKAGIVVGGFAFLAIILTIIWCCYKKAGERRQRRARRERDLEAGPTRSRDT